MSIWDRAHRWDASGRCSLCAMLRTWEGARYGCTGVDVQTPKKAARQRAQRVMRGQRKPDAFYSAAYRARKNARRDVDAAARGVLEMWEARR